MSMEDISENKIQWQDTLIVTDVYQYNIKYKRITCKKRFNASISFQDPHVFKILDFADYFKKLEFET